MSKETIRVLFVGAVALVVMALMLGVGSQVSVPFSRGVAVEKKTGTYATKQIDTIVINRDPGAQGITFAAHWKDSVALLNTAATVIRRVVDGTISAVPATGDSLSGWSAFTSTADGNSTPDKFNNGKSLTGTITLNPLADQYLVIVKYDTLTATQQGVSTPTVVYEVIKQFSNR